MIYSCFDPKAGLYTYYEGPDVYPLNADLPVPSLPPEIAGIGVPSIDAARPLPGGVKVVGKGWHARGMVVSCGRTPLGDLTLPGFGWDMGVRLLPVLAMWGGILYYLRAREKRTRRRRS